jgi:protease I
VVTTPDSAPVVAFMVANEGAEQIELTHPWQALQRAGARPVLVAPEPGEVQAFHHLEAADRFPVGALTGDADASAYAAIVLPGGVANPDILRRDPGARRVLADAARAGIVIAAICHGPWSLIDAGVAAGRTLAAWPSLATDLHNAGATWTSARSHRDGNLLSAQGADDVTVFTDLLLHALGLS